MIGRWKYRSRQRVPECTRERNEWLGVLVNGLICYLRGIHGSVLPKSLFGWSFNRHRRFPAKMKSCYITHKLQVFPLLTTTVPVLVALLWAADRLFTNLLGDWPSINRDEFLVLKSIFLTSWNWCCCRHLLITSKCWCWDTCPSTTHNFRLG